MLAVFQNWLDEKKRAKQQDALTDSDYAFLFDEAEPGRYVCFDCETTGLDRKNDRIITLSAIEIRNNEILTSQSLNLVVKQQEDISAESIAVHQIRNVDVEMDGSVYPDEQSAIKEFLHFIRGATLVGYYLEFDVAMVNRVIKPWLGIELQNPKIEVSNLYFAEVNKKYKRSCIEPNIDLSFDTILSELDIPNIGQHDAFSDALMTALIFIKLKRLESST